MVSLLILFSLFGAVSGENYLCYDQKCQRLDGTYIDCNQEFYYCNRKSNTGWDTDVCSWSGFDGGMKYYDTCNEGQTCTHDSITGEGICVGSKVGKKVGYCYDQKCKNYDGTYIDCNQEVYFCDEGSYLDTAGECSRYSWAGSQNKVWCTEGCVYGKVTGKARCYSDTTSSPATTAYPPWGPRSSAGPYEFSTAQPERRSATTLIITVAVIVGILQLGCVLCCIRVRRRRQRALLNQIQGGGVPMLAIQSQQPPPSATTNPPAQGAYPPAQGAYPPAQGAYPPAQGAYPPAQGAFSPATGSVYPPGQYPPAQGACPPAQGAYPPTQGAYPPTQGVYPPASGSQKPSHDFFPSASGKGEDPSAPLETVSTAEDVGKDSSAEPPPPYSSLFVN